MNGGIGDSSKTLAQSAAVTGTQFHPWERSQRRFACGTASKICRGGCITMRSTEVLIDTANNVVRSSSHSVIAGVILRGSLFGLTRYTDLDTAQIIC